MLNIVVPLAGKSPFFDSVEYPYPKPLVEINGKTMIETALQGYLKLEEPKRFVFILDKMDCDLFHLDRVLNLLTTGKCVNVVLPGSTKGAACSCLMAASYISSEDPLVIANGDQTLDVEISKVLSDFRSRSADCGVITFESVHPKWSYVRRDAIGNVVETAEKKPISRDAIAGFYYFRQGKDFVSAAMRMIEKDAHVAGSFYVAPAINELILENKKVIGFAIPAEAHHALYSPKKIAEFESYSRGRKF
jgi:NDP-sugar pyrophosphorylase family protein